MEVIELQELILENGDQEFKAIHVVGALFLLTFKSKKSNSSVKLSQKQAKQLGEWFINQAQ